MSLSSCFFCQNLLSDYVEKILPASRQAEVRKHLEGCSDCSQAHRDLQALSKTWDAVALKDISGDLALRIMETCEGSGTPILRRRRVGMLLAIVGLPLVAAAVIAAVYPRAVTRVIAMVEAGTRNEPQFVRFYPLFHGAAEILEAQGSLLESRETLRGSLWEEGGLSPEEFERAFQPRGLAEEK